MPALTTKLTIVFVPPDGSAAGAEPCTVTTAQVSAVPSQPCGTRSRLSPVLIPATVPASSMDPAVIPPGGTSVMGMSEGPLKLAEAVVSKVCAGTPGLAVLVIAIAAGTASGPAGPPVRASTATWPTAAMPGRGR